MGGVVVGAVWRGVWCLEGEFLWREGYLKKRLDIVNRFRDKMRLNAMGERSLLVWRLGVVVGCGNWAWRWVW